MSSIFVNIKNLIRSNHVKNIVESSYLIRCVRILAGASVYTIKRNPKGIIVSTFTLYGFLSFILWYSLYFYSLYNIYIEDQTILRALYNTKLKRYGDEAERVTQIIFIVYAAWKVSFDLSGSTEDLQHIIDIDKALRDLGEEVDFSTKLNSLSIICLLQIVISGTRILSVWLSFRNLDIGMPLSKLFQIVFTDFIGFIIIAQYCTYLIILRRRYKIINKILWSIKVSTSDFFIIRLNQPGISSKASLQAKSSCKKLKACGKIYSMVYQATKTANVKFGSVLLFTMSMALLLIILYLYYFMEATASGLFHDLEKYVNFLIYVFWQIGFSLSFEYFCIYFSEVAVKESFLHMILTDGPLMELSVPFLAHPETDVHAKLTPQIIHDIINSNSDPQVISEALHLSLQMLHQTPVFTAHGLFNLDYTMLLEGARSVTTFLVILLQSVTDKRSNE